jgi:hypothetical protein
MSCDWNQKKGKNDEMTHGNPPEKMVVQAGTKIKPGGGYGNHGNGDDKTKLKKNIRRCP